MSLLPDILFWSSELGCAVFWAALAAAIMRPVLKLALAIVRRLRPTIHVIEG